MQYDLLIKNGTVIDGSGMPRFRADVGIVHGKIATIGKIREGAKEVIDAEGHVVAPGFIDAHTHMDAQVFWDPLGTCSCWHGITSVVMGNCGFSLAPCGEKDKLLVMRNLERAEDIAPEAMEAGIKWSWTTFPEYLDAVDRLPKGINYAAYMGHSALRTYVMGERAFTDAATNDDLAAMKQEVRNAIRAGAIGFTTSRTRNHQTPQGQPVASRLATWDEVQQLVGVMGELGAGIFEIAGEDTGLNPDRINDYLGRLKALALETGVPVTFGMFSNRKAPDYWRHFYSLAQETVAAGGRMFVQAHSRSLNLVLSFETVMPFDRLPVWRDIRKLPLAEQEAALRNPDLRQKLVEAASQRSNERIVGAEARPANYKWLFVMDRATPPYRSVAEIAAAQNKHPGGGHYRSRAGEEDEAILPPAARERERRACIGDDQTSPFCGDVLRLRGPCIADHGFFITDAPSQSRGARETKSDFGRSRSHALACAGLILGIERAWSLARRLECRCGDV